MTDLIKIAVDAMGGDNSPNKTIDGIIHNHNKNTNVFYKIFGDEKKISDLIGNKIKNDFYEIIHTTDVVKSTDSPLEGAKRGKNTSMWLAVESVKKRESDIVISAGNTGALLVISKLNIRAFNFTIYLDVNCFRPINHNIGNTIDFEQLFKRTEAKHVIATFLSNFFELSWC